LKTLKLSNLRDAGLKPLHLLGEVIFTPTLSVNIRCGAMQGAAEGISVSKRHRHDFKTEFVQLFLLMDFAGFYTNGFGIQYKYIH